jgi:hypothetical protein
LSVTSRGKRLAPRAIAAVEQVDTEFFRGVPTGDAVRLLRALEGVPAQIAGRDSRRAKESADEADAPRR